MNKILLAAMLLVSSSASAHEIEVTGSSLLVRNSALGAKLFHDEQGFFVVKNNETVAVENCFVDKSLRGLSNESLELFLGKDNVPVRVLSEDEVESLDKKDIKHFESMSQAEQEEIIAQINAASTSGYIVLSQTSQGDYVVTAQQRLLGGGAFGAWLGACLGKAAVHVGAQIIIWGIAACTGPAAPAVIAGLNAAFIVPIEATSTAAAIAGGLTLAVVTGPI